MPIVCPIEPVREDIRDHIEDMIRDLGQDCFQQAHAPLYDKLESDSRNPLYEGCTSFTRLSAVLALVNLKARFWWSDKSLTQLLVLLKKMLPKTTHCRRINTRRRRYYVLWEWRTKKSMLALMIAYCIEISL